ncbi:MAG: Mu transposase C-terminal domain-containing protein, partial [Magnetospirillum sp.]|nr:Mu transposase C-terminal domain-containing protein [Magnetospirillum sp.]
GWQPSMVTAAEAADLTRPYEVRTVQRGTVSVLGQSYFSRLLTDWHGCEVLVGYDIQDASKVYVRDPDGRLICEAGFEANRRAVVPRSYLDAAIERRHEGRLRRAQEHVDEIHAERGHVLIDATATPVLPDNVAALRDHLVLELTATSVPSATTAAIPETASARYQRWRDLGAALAAGQEVTDDERRWHQRYQLSYEFKAQDEIFGSFTDSAATA